MASLDRIINITTFSETTRIEKNNFNIMLFMCPHALTQARTMGITTADQLLDLGFARDSSAYITAQTYFAQSPHARQMYIGKVKASAVSFGIADTSKIAGVYGFDITYRTDGDAENTRQSVRATVPASSTQQDVFDELAEQMQALPFTVSTTGQLTVGSNNDDLIWSIKPFGNLVQTQVTASESYTEALAEAEKEYPYFYGVAIDSTENNTVLEVARWVEANKKLFGVAVGESTFDGSITNDLASQIREFGFVRTFMQASKNTGEMPNVAMFGLNFAYLPGQNTWANKRLAIVRPDNLLEGEYNSATQKRANTFEPFNGGIRLTQNGMTASGEWIDVVVFSDWLTQEIQTDVAFLMVNAPKIPYTDGGIDQICNACIPALRLGIQRGGIAPDELDFNGNLVPSYRIEKPRSTEISPNNKASRILRDLVIIVRLAGAIHNIEMQLTLTYGLETQGQPA